MVENLVNFELITRRSLVRVQSPLLAKPDTEVSGFFVQKIEMLAFVNF